MRINNEHWLYTRPVAHRGLHGGSIPENSKAAFAAAIEKGYPIETDVHLTKDGEVAVFHDDNLIRMTGIDADISSKTMDELRQIKLASSDQTIISLKELLDLTDGKVPLLIELKSPLRSELEKKTVEILSSYKGEFALQSFNPFALRRVKKLAPQILRGQLSAFYEWDEKMNKLKKMMLKRMYFNFLTKPDFISYHDINLPFKRAKKKGRPLLAWTVTNKEAEKKAYEFADNIIFEKFTPEKYL